MPVSRPRFAIVTPAKNEFANVPRIVAAIASQTALPTCWFFINDHSTDGTAEQFEKEIARHPALAAHCRSMVILHETTDTAYALGTKYSTVVRFGFDKVQEWETKEGTRFDYLALLDCDVFPEPAYYEGLLEEMEKDPRLGIASGGTQIEIDGAERRSLRVPRTHAAGMMRMWRRSCFEQAGYFPSYSQDAVSEARAIMLGWRSRSFSRLGVEMRTMGARTKYDYYGKSHYVRWVPVYYSLLYALKLVFQGKTADARSFLRGYKEAKAAGLPRIDDPLVKRYFQWRLFYRLTGR